MSERPTLLILAILTSACVGQPIDEPVGETSAAVSIGGQCRHLIEGQLACDESWWDPWAECMCVELLISLAASGDEVPDGAYDECYQHYYSMNERDCERLTDARATEIFLCRNGYVNPDDCPEDWRPDAPTEPENPPSSDDGGRAGAPRETPGVKRPTRL